MAHILGVYYAPEHSRQSDRDYIAALQPPVVRLFDNPDVQQIADVHALAPNAIIAPRTWVIDDNHGEAVRKLMSDPVGTGLDHAQQYRGQLDRWQQQARERGLRIPPADRIYFNSANEPNQGGTPDKINAYAIAFLDRCTELGLRAGAPCLGVGWPDNTGPDTPVDWSPYVGLEQAIQRGNHWLILHEYFYKSGPQDGWRWWAGRHLQCPFNVPIVLGEIGIDNYVDAERWRNEGGNRGWQGNVDAETYASMIEHHVRGSSRRVIAVLPFITDYRNNAWESFDTGPANNALLARKDRMVPQGDASPDVVEISPPEMAYVGVRAGANIRTQPVNGAVIVAVPYREAVSVSGKDIASGWLRVTYQGSTGWMSPGLVTATQPAPPVVTPPVEPVPADNNWKRAYEFVRGWEGGWADHPSDPGDATMKGITLGTYTQWRQAHGLPVPTKEELRNIWDSEVEQIMFEWYWKRSGADMQPWPMCLAHFDTAINAGVGMADEMLRQSNGSFLTYMGNLIQWYTTLGNFDTFGRAWMRRRADLLLTASR